MTARDNLDVDIFLPGVYKIALQDGRCYVGSSWNVGQRWKQHQRSLNRGSHHSPYLQHAWDKYGPLQFSIAIIEICDDDELFDREQYWLDVLKPEFNVLMVAGSRLGHKLSPNQKARLKAARRAAAGGEDISPIPKLVGHKLSKNLNAEFRPVESRWDDPELIASDVDVYGSMSIYDTYDGSFKSWCRDCFECDAAKDDVLCPMCRYAHDRKN